RQKQRQRQHNQRTHLHRRTLSATAHAERNESLRPNAPTPSGAHRPMRSYATVISVAQIAHRSMFAKAIYALGSGRAAGPDVSAEVRPGGRDIVTHADDERDRRRRDDA